ncbi:unnamed protein product [Dracunculus medinensis]|uniref:Microtubule-associated protein n=1 Tax=Dracunculus medinensis TaxID=318479 RepID=A0A0N4UGH0_DRAME|nr:unnamed protein product [Dracunculus medinensis]
MNDINPIRDDNDMLNIEQQIASNDESGTQVAHDEHYKKGAQFAHGEYFEKDAFSAIPTYPSNQPEPSQPEQIHLSSHSESIHPSSQPKSTQNVDISKKSSSSDEPISKHQNELHKSTASTVVLKPSAQRHKTGSSIKSTSTHENLKASNVTANPTVPNSPKRNKKYENVSSRINSITAHKPGGGNVKIFSQKSSYQVSSKIGSLANINRTPGGGHILIENHKVEFKQNAKPRIDARSDHKRSQSVKKIPTQKLEWKAESKVGSLSNITHKPAGGNVKIPTTKLKWKAESKIGSLDSKSHGNSRASLDSKDHGNSRASLDSKGHGNSRENASKSTSQTSSRTSSFHRADNKQEKNELNLPGARDPIDTTEALGL